MTAKLLKKCPARSAYLYKNGPPLALHVFGDVPSKSVSLRAQYLAVVLNGVHDRSEDYVQNIRTPDLEALLQSSEAKAALIDATISQRLFNLRWRNSNLIVRKPMPAGGWDRLEPYHEKALKSHFLRLALIASMPNGRMDKLEYLLAAEHATWERYCAKFFDEPPDPQYRYHPAYLPRWFGVTASRHTINSLTEQEVREMCSDWLPNEQSASRIITYRLLKHGLNPFVVAWIMGRIDHEWVLNGVSARVFAASIKKFSERIVDDFLDLGMRAI